MTAFHLDQCIQQGYKNIVYAYVVSSQELNYHEFTTGKRSKWTVFSGAVNPVAN